MEVQLERHIRYNPERIVTEIVHSCQDLRVMVINLSPGQVLPPHTSSSSVSLQVLAGRAELVSGCDWVPAGPGTIRFYPPQEPHGVRALEEPVTVLATLAPRP
ncbi:MAG: cupin domain-containing protein [Bacillota bacterium]